MGRAALLVSIILIVLWSYSKPGREQADAADKTAAAAGWMVSAVHQMPDYRGIQPCRFTPIVGFTRTSYS